MSRCIHIIYINGKSYQINITHENELYETLVEVVSSTDIFGAFDGTHIEFDDDKVLPLTERKKIIEEEQLARIIWTDLLKMFE